MALRVDWRTMRCMWRLINAYDCVLLRSVAFLLAVGTCHAQSISVRTTGVAVGDAVRVVHGNSSPSEIVRDFQFVQPVSAGRSLIGLGVPTWGVYESISTGVSPVRTRYSTPIPALSFLEIPTSASSSFSASGLTADYQLLPPANVDGFGFRDALILAEDTVIREGDYASGSGNFLDLNVNLSQIPPGMVSDTITYWDHFSRVKVSINGDRILWLGGLRSTVRSAPIVLPTGGPSFVPIDGLFAVQNRAFPLQPTPENPDPAEVSFLVVGGQSIEIDDEVLQVPRREPVISFDASPSGVHWGAIVRAKRSNGADCNVVMVDGSVAVIRGNPIITGGSFSIPGLPSQVTIEEIHGVTIDDDGDWLLAGRVKEPSRRHAVLSKDGLLLKEGSNIPSPTLGQNVTLRGKPRGLTCNASGDWVIVWKGSGGNRIRDCVVVNGYAAFVQFEPIAIDNSVSVEAIELDPRGVAAIGQRYTGNGTGAMIDIGFPALLLSSETPDPSRTGVVLSVPTTMPTFCDSIDFNQNNVFPEDQDVIDFFNVLAGGPCPYPEPCDIDFNNNAVYPEDQDVIAFFEVLAGSDCPN
jgi:prepilin-type processing-associated H-X9-DG protein